MMLATGGSQRCGPDLPDAAPWPTAAHTAGLPGPPLPQLLPVAVGKGALDPGPGVDLAAGEGRARLSLGAPGSEGQ